jgi:hypothetical protein
MHMGARAVILFLRRGTIEPGATEPCSHRRCGFRAMTSNDTDKEAHVADTASSLAIMVL